MWVAGGSFGTFVERLDLGERSGAFDVYASQSLRRSHGHRPDSGGRMENYLLRLGWAASPHWEAGYVFNHTHNRAIDPGVEGAPPGPPSTRGERYLTDDWFHVATITHRSGGATGTLRAYLNEGDADWFRRQYSHNADTFGSWRLYGLRWRETVAPWPGGEIVAGADLDFDRGTIRTVPPAPAPAGAFGPMTMRLFSPYFGVNHTFTLGNGLKVRPSAGARHYSHNRFPARWAPQAGVTVSSGRTQFFAGGSRAVNYPGLEVAVFSRVLIPALAESWRTLRPEEAGQFEAGIRHTVADRVAVAVTVFQTRARDRYVIVFPPPPPPRYANLGSYRLEGIELSADAQWRRNLAWFAGASLLRASPGGIPYAPGHTLTAGLNWQFAAGWRLSADAVYVSSMHAASEARVAGAGNPAVVGAQGLLNARLTRSLSWGARPANRAEFYLSGENLTDRKFAYQPGYTAPGVNFILGMRLKR